MILYHAGFEKIEFPDVHYGRKNADFGQGFYLSENKEFIYRWAKSRKDKNTIINTYELDTNDLNIKCFNRNEEWFNYIFNNRSNKPDTINADVIIGPIANDTIYDTFGIITSGLLKQEDAMKLLLIGPEYIQLVIKSEKGINNLKWLSADILSSEQVDEYRKMVVKEEKEYQEIFMEELIKIQK